MNRNVLTLAMVCAVTLMPALPCAQALELPDEALLLLASSAADPCSLCAEQERKKAYRILSDAFIPGQALESDDFCRLVKAGAGDDNELTLTCYPSETLKVSLNEGERLPEVVFRFYTLQNRLVGISEDDLTGDALAELYRASRPGRVFEGRIILVPYKYGEGATYNYFPQTNKLLIHCRLVNLGPVPHD